MRIQQIRFQNLNSLVGEWEIDLSHPAYLSDGIFAITGPTGAGKTTILDAICLALYGRTPRLERVNKSSNEIMSRHCTSCFAEITFVTGKGHYRCHWSQQQARKRQDGELQHPKHEISDVTTGQVLENKLRDVAARVEQITGMNYNQFSRSMMLAQGGFAAFLRASADERAPILEQITETEIYSMISRQVHQRRGEVKNQLDNMRAAASNLKVLGEDEEQRLAEELRINMEREGQQTARLKGLGEALAWLESLDNLTQEIDALNLEWQEFERRQQSFLDDELRLNRARQAMSLDGPFAGLLSLRALQSNEMTEMEGVRDKLTVARIARDEARQNWEKARWHLNDCKEQRRLEGEKATRVRALDVIIRQQEQQISDSNKDLANAATALAALQSQLNEQKDRLAAINLHLDKIKSYQRENSQDSGLTAKLAGIAVVFQRVEEMVAARCEKGEEERQTADKWQLSSQTRDEMAAAHAENSRQAEQRQDKLRDFQKKLQDVSQGHELAWWLEQGEGAREQEQRLQELARLLGDMGERAKARAENQRTIKTLTERGQQLAARNEKLANEVARYEREVSFRENEVALLSRIRDLEEERTRLQDGSPCPLCGATQHPFAQGNIPPAEESQQALNEARKTLKQASMELHKQQLQQVETNKELELCLKTCQEQELLQGQTIERYDELAAGLNPPLAGQDPEPEVKARLKTARDRVGQLTQLIRELEQLHKDEKKLQDECEKCRQALDISANDWQQACWQLEQAARDNERIKGELLSLETEVEKIYLVAASEVLAFGITGLTEQNLADVLEGLNQRKNHWESQQNDMIARERERSITDTDISNLTARITEQQAANLSQEKRLAEQQSQQSVRQNERLALYGEFDPDEEERRRDAGVKLAEEALEQTRQIAEAAGAMVDSLEMREKTLADSTGLRAAALQQNENEFARLWQEAGFSSEAEYATARMTKAEQAALATVESQLKQDKTELQTRLADRTCRLRQERDKKLTEQSRPTLQAEQRECIGSLKELQDSIGGIKQVQLHNATLRQQMQEQQQQIEQQKREMARWQLLHDLIGSGDGKKYRNFAQGLTFDIMIGHANRQLQKMTDRYLLRRNTREPLELDVIDYYQGGQIRSTANLSGGESFLVSLALALGLSNMASKKVSVDSLFLDEGFGVLDEEALDTALQTLAGLHQDGKLIGLISHVPALKERITTQIKVEPLSGGRSKLQGPGITGS